MRRLAAAVLQFALVALPVCAHAAPQAGRYDISTQIVTRGASTIQPPAQHQLCLDDAAFASGAAYRPSSKPEECTVSDFVQENGRVRFGFVCKAETVTLSGTGGGTPQATTFNLVLAGTLTQAGGDSEFRMSLRGTRVGDCP
jgi:hypothetical protein